MKKANEKLEKRRTTKAERERLKRLAAVPDDQIDTSDIPVWRGPQAAR
jgi:hypothetical protein